MRSLRLACCAVLFGAASASAEVTPADAVALDADVVVMGEVHDVPAHHANQAYWVERLRPAAVVFEMLPQALGPVAGANWDRPADVLGARLDWEGRGWPDFTAYDRIFKAAGGVEILGAEVPRAMLARAAAEGAAVAFGADPAMFGLNEPLPEAEQTARESELATAHCGLLPPELLPGMVEAQRLRDAMLAARTLEALDRTGGPVAVIAGNGHARRDRGVPSLLVRARPGLSVVSLGQFTRPRDDAPFDAWVVTSASGSTPGDPCDALR